MSTNSTRSREIVDSLGDKEYRDAFVVEHISTGLPFQIRAMRRARGWTQHELALQTGMAQGTVSLLEDPNYARFTLSTLKRVASAFDVALIVRFAPYSELVDWVVDLSHEDLAVPGFEEDAALDVGESGATSEETLDALVVRDTTSLVPIPIAATQTSRFAGGIRKQASTQLLYAASPAARG